MVFKDIGFDLNPKTVVFTVPSMENNLKCIFPEGCPSVRLRAMLFIPMLTLRGTSAHRMALLTAQTHPYECSNRVNLCKTAYSYWETYGIMRITNQVMCAFDNTVWLDVRWTLRHRQHCITCVNKCKKAGGYCSVVQRVQVWLTIVTCLPPVSLLSCHSLLHTVSWDRNHVKIILNKSHRFYYGVLQRLRGRLGSLCLKVVRCV